jgi:hypothetical protein
MKIPFEEPLAVGLEVIELQPDVVTAILVTLHAGWEYASMSVDVHSGAGEVTITERLRDGMRRALITLPWGKTMIIPPGSESRSRPEVLLPDGRTDIPIFSIEIFLRLQEHDPHAIVECKRIAGNNARLCREYVVEGIDRFQSGKYGGKHTVGFMAGYLVAQDASAAVAGINALLSRKQREAEHLSPSDLVTLTWRSRHPRVSSQPIALHHAFVALGLPPP